MYIHTVGWLVIHSLAHIRIFDLGAFFIARGETLVSVPTEEVHVFGIFDWNDRGILLY